MLATSPPPAVDDAADDDSIALSSLSDSDFILAAAGVSVIPLIVAVDVWKSGRGVVTWLAVSGNRPPSVVVWKLKMSSSAFYRLSHSPSPASCAFIIASDVIDGL